MKLTASIYYARFKQKKILMRYDFHSTEKALNWMGFSWIDSRYGFIKQLLKLEKHKVIVTDSDLIAHDDYLECIADQTICLVYREGKDASANKIRLHTAKTKLQHAGKTVKYFASEQALQKWLAKK